MSYPLLPVPAYPGPRPPRWRPLARRRWAKIMRQREYAKWRNFPKLYGRGVADLSVTEFTHKPTSKG